MKRASCSALLPKPCCSPTSKCVHLSATYFLCYWMLTLSRAFGQVLLIPFLPYRRSSWKMALVHMLQMGVTLVKGTWGSTHAWKTDWWTPQVTHDFWLTTRVSVFFNSVCVWVSEWVCVCVCVCVFSHNLQKIWKYYAKSLLSLNHLKAHCQCDDSLY